MRWKMLFKLGLSVVVLVAVYLFFALHNEDDSSSTSQVIPDQQTGQHEKDNLHLNKESGGDVGSTDDKSLRSDAWRNGIHLSLVACGDREKESVILLKSAVLFTKTPLVFHIFAELQLQDYFKRQIDFWPDEFRMRVEYHIYNLSFPEGEVTNEWKNLFKPCASQRLFIPSLLTDVDALLYVDTDILFLRPLEDIWAFLHKFNRTQLVALSPEHEDSQSSWYHRFARHPYYGEQGVNSGVMLMNLTRIRQSQWLESLKQYYKDYKLKITWGDQDLLNIYFHYYPEQLYVYPCEWNYRPDHCMYMSVCKGGDRDGASVLHGNRRVMHNDKQPAFKAAYDTFVKHQFGADLKYEMLVALKRELEKTKYTACGKLPHIFYKQIEKYIDSLDIYKNNEKYGG
ncbi:glucoside xylosyltransferase 2-like [Ylistrum balloti]|uniref:glucoside xylosyltransferase 2-like n=1 Tax=Ylistrum balloti TaxID=509963 RepID=UPI0029057F21|nr:glucoside xylosyltransferase 2-like [Ylistrum balloti]